MATTPRLMVLLTGLTLSLSFAPTTAAAATAATEADIQRGADDFRRGCAMCHGLSAKGDGRIADLLKAPPKDLTRLTRRNHGVFPADRIRQAIDGRADVRAHGGRDMPIWGLTFQDPGRSDNQETEVRARIDRIVAFLEAIQEPSKAAQHEEREGLDGNRLGR